MAALYSADAIDALSDTPFVAFHVSGGTTDMLMVCPSEQGFDIELLGTSLDLHAGQAVDRIGVTMGLSFPCGRELEELAANCTEKVPKPRICVKEGICNLSGLENLALDLYRKTGDAPLVAAYTLKFISDTLQKMSVWLREAYGPVPILFSGGVMSNRIIARELKEALGNVYFAEPAFSADNAAGVALLCRARALGS